MAKALTPKQILNKKLSDAISEYVKSIKKDDKTPAKGKKEKMSAAQMIKLGNSLITRGLKKQADEAKKAEAK